MGLNWMGLNWMKQLWSDASSLNWRNIVDLTQLCRLWSRLEGPHQIVCFLMDPNAPNPTLCPGFEMQTFTTTPHHASGDCRCMVVRGWSTGGLNWLMTMQLFYVRKEDKQGSLHLHPTHAKIVEIKSSIKGKMRPPPPPPLPPPQKEKTRHSF